MQQLKNKAQAGLTLIETLVALAIFALIVGGALSLFGSASSSQTTTQMTSDLSAIRAATKAVFLGQGGYGTASLDELLINGKKVPTTMAVSGTPGSRVINHSQNGTVTVTGASTQFNVTVTNLSTDVCLGLVGSSGWSNIKIGATSNTAPVSPATASAQCAASDPITVVFTST